jgi:hypothetical protein
MPVCVKMPTNSNEAMMAFYSPASLSDISSAYFSDTSTPSSDPLKRSIYDMADESKVQNVARKRFAASPLDSQLDQAMTFTGKGSYRGLDGTSYEGSWKDGKYHGQGIFERVSEVSTDLIFYKGNYNNGKMWGEGEAQYQNGTIYKGLWLESKFHGEGKLTFLNPRHNELATLEGEFDQGEIAGVVKAVFADNTQYIGAWKSWDDFGPGVAILSDGTKIEGKWISKKLHGRVKITYPEERAPQVRQLLITYNQGNWSSRTYVLKDGAKITDYNIQKYSNRNLRIIL